MTSFGLEQHILDKIVGVLSQHPRVDRAVIYGSRATGTFKPHSDIDIAVLAPTMDEGEFLRLRFELVELPIVFKLDVLHLDPLRNEALREQIATLGREFYARRSG
jgi:proline iminopeptidase